MKCKNYIICQKKQATDTDGYLLLISKGRTNKVKKSIGIKINRSQFDKYWNEKDQCFRSGLSNYKLYNETIAEAYEELEKYDGELSEMPKDEKSFIHYWQSLIKVMTNHGSRIKHDTVLNKLVKYVNSKNRNDLKFSEITPQFLREYQHYLATAADPKTLSTNQVTHYLKMFKSVISKKIKDTPRLYVVNPFASITFDYNADDVKRTILAKDEISKLLTGRIDDRKTDMWRDMIVFEIFAAGMRVSDIMTLRWNMIKVGNINEPAKIEYQMYKTGKGMSIPLSINLCKILMKVIGAGEQIENLYSNEKRPFAFFRDGGDPIEMSVIEMESEIDRHCIKADIEADMMTRLILNKFVSGGVTKYKGYSFSKKVERSMKAAIDYAGGIREEIDSMYIYFSGDLINQHIKENNCSADFVFEYLPSDMFKNIGADNNFGRMTEEQYRKLMKAESIFNRQLKKVGSTLKIDSPLTSHVGRHTFTQLLLDGDIKTHEITQALGHSSVKVTEHYIRNKFNKDKTDAIIMKVGNSSENAYIQERQVEVLEY